MSEPSVAATPLLELSEVGKTFGGGLFQRRRSVALDGVSFAIPETPAAIVTVAGESGSGKTTLAQLVLGLLGPTAGRIWYRGRSLDALSRADRVRFRREVQAIFQDPYDVCNPFYPVDHLFKVVLRRFRIAATASEARTLVREALEAVALAPETIEGRYPHELSGGQLQRLLVARAFLVRPRLIVADEPVSMVDASVRVEILETMARLRDVFGISFVYITHDLSTAALLGDEILILHGGSIVERGPIAEVIAAPRHEYTRVLIRSIPVPDPDVRWGATNDDAGADARAKVYT